jgi:hypothetical protein
MGGGREEGRKERILTLSLALSPCLIRLSADHCLATTTFSTTLCLSFSSICEYLTLSSVLVAMPSYRSNVSRMAEAALVRSRDSDHLRGCKKLELR